jgi:hypothetical protein
MITGFQDSKIMQSLGRAIRRENALIAFDNVLKCPYVCYRKGSTRNEISMAKNNALTEIMREYSGLK